MKGFKKVWALFEDITAGTLFCTGITLIFYGVVMRYVFNEPKAWVEEIAGYTVVWGTLLGVPIALRNNHHIQVDMLYEKLPKAWRRGVDIFANSMGILFCVIFTYFGYSLVEKRFSSGMVSMDVGVPMWIVYLILPISGFMFLMRFIERTLDVVQDKEVKHDNPII